jgi:hypothetical protein
VLVIRLAQMESLGLDTKARFEREMAAWLSDEYPDRFGGAKESEAGQLVRAAMQTGARHGIETYRSLTVLIALMADYGERFELSPDARWGREMLAHPALPADLKMRMISERFDSRTQGRAIVRISAGEGGGRAAGS